MKLLAAALLLVSASALAAAQAPAAGPKAGTAPAGAPKATPGASVTHLVALLLGQGDTPPDPNGSGASNVDIYMEGAKVVKCQWSVIVQNLKDGSSPKGAGASGVVAMHIHNGSVGVSGPVVFSLGMPLDFIAANPLGQAQYGATNTNLTMLEPLAAVAKNPSGYYVNVHTLPSFPNGAIRGQLRGIAPTTNNTGMAPMPGTASGPMGSAPKAHAPKAHAPKASAPKASAPKAHAPKAHAPKASGPMASGPMASGPMASGPMASGPVASGPKAAAPMGTTPAGSPMAASPPMNTPTMGPMASSPSMAPMVPTTAPAPAPEMGPPTGEAPTASVTPPPSLAAGARWQTSVAVLAVAALATVLAL